MARQSNSSARLAILSALADLDDAAGATRIGEQLAARGVDLQPRTIRLYLLQLDRQGLTRLISRRRGRLLTSQGREALTGSTPPQTVGFLASKLNDLAYRQSLDLRSGQGTVCTSVAWIKAHDLSRTMLILEPVYQRRLGVGWRLALEWEGGELAGRTVPRGSFALAVPATSTLTGLLWKAGIPAKLRLGGRVEMQDGRPTRFADTIEYGGTTADPVELFTRAGLIRARDCATSGSGILGASFSEIPSAALRDAKRVFACVDRWALASVLLLGLPGRPVLGLPVGPQSVGIVAADGLNPFAALHEAGIPLVLHAAAGLEDVSRFEPYRDVLPRGRRESPMID